MTKIIVGTANFINNYGLNKFRYNEGEIKKILRECNKRGINSFDVAFSYGFNKRFLEKVNFKNKKIILKFKLPLQKKTLFLKNIEKKIIDYLKYFRIKKYEAILLHNSNDLTTVHSDKLKNILYNLLKKKITKKIGVSIYNPKELRFIFKQIKPQIIQTPFNIFDKRIIESKFLEKIKKEKIQIHIRSVFLQGVIFKSRSFIEKKFKNKIITKTFENFDRTCKSQNISRLEYVVDFIKKQKAIDYIIFGFDNTDQLKEIYNFYKKKNHVNQKNFKINNSRFLDPREWKS